MAPADGDLARAAAEKAARQSYGKLVAYLALRTRDVAAAEDALADAFARALADWPARGIPARPEAWLLTVARRKLIDVARRNRTGSEAGAHLQLITEEIDAMSERGTEIPDDRLALMFACAHPAIDATMRAPLMLQTVLGFDADSVASAFLVAPATMGQRLVRAKAKIKQAGIPFRVPERDELAERLDAVLDAIYAAFAEGWSDAIGADARRRKLAEEGLWLGRLLSSLMPQEPEALGLLALMLFAEARRAARRDTEGAYVPLAAQDTALWDEAMIDEAETLLACASRIGAVGRFQLEAAIQSAHVTRRRTGQTDWQAIVTLYDALTTITGSPVVAINRAVALGELHGAAAGLAAIDRIDDGARLTIYQPYWAARADLLAKSNDAAAAADAYRRAIGLESDPAVRAFLQQRLVRLHN